MGRHVFLSVLAFTILAVAVGIFLLPGKEPREAHLPWQVSISPEGGLRVFGLELGRTTLGETELAFREPAEVSLFSQQSGAKVIEAYFDNVDISGLRARVVVVMDADSEEVEAIYNRGVRVANMGGGRHKVTLADSDMERLKQRPIASLTYIPRINLTAELVASRFGEPAERLREPEGGIEHWLYPDKGLDVALDPEGKEVLQYVMPRHFEQLRTPLHQANSATAAQ